jgi:TPR repeat protein
MTPSRWSVVVGAVVWSLAAEVATAGERAWVEARSPNFTVYSDAGESEARRVAWQFEQIRGAFQRIWRRARLTTGRPMLIMAVRDESGLKALAPAYWERKGGVRPAGIAWRGHDKHCVALRVDAQGQGEENPYHVLYHEYAHVLLDVNFQRLPLWLSEGLAEFYGATIVRDDAILQGKAIRMHVMLLREERHLPIETLFRVGHTSPEYNEETRATIFYAQSWALVHYLLLGSRDGAQARKLVAFLDHLSEGMEESAAAERAFGDLKALGRDLEGYVRRFAFLVGKLPVTPQTGPGVTLRRLSPAEASAARGDFLLNTGRLDAARSLLADALERDPDQPLAHAAMGGVLWREGKRRDAQTSLERAVILDPRNAFAQYLLGAVTLNGEEGPDRLARVQAALERAVELDPNLAPAFALLGDVSAARGDDPERALRLARRAVSLEPTVSSHRIAVGRILRLMAMVEEARAEGERARSLARSDGERQRAAAFLESLAEPLNALPKDPAAAVRVLGRRCAAGRKEDCTELADRYRKGEGVEKDDVRAAALYQGACDGGHALACAWLASAHAEGSGVPQDEARALGYHERACGGGETWSCAQLAWALEKGVLRPRDDARAAELYEQACDGGQAWACSRLGWFHQTGRAVAQDPARAASLYRKACEQGESPGCVGLGWLHETGRGVDKDEARAATLYEKACTAERPDLDGCFGLASLHERGAGVARDESRAAALYRKACDGGVAEACRRLDGSRKRRGGAPLR